MMKHRGKNLALVLAGVLIGSVMSGPAVHAAAEVIEAYRSSHPIYVDGVRVELEAYAINGNNYVKLRDVGEAVGFNVYWDGAVQIERGKPYSGEAPNQGEPEPEPRIEQMTDVNPAVLTGAYTREAYEALRQTIVTGSESAPVAMTEETRTAMQEAAAAIGSWPGYHMRTSADGKTCFYAKNPGSYEEAAAYCQPFIDELTGTDAERIRSIAFYVCDRLTYASGTTATPRTALTDKSVHPGNCMSYAHCFKFLCDLAGIPCVLVHSDTHQWNQVYADGRWMSIDVSSIDVGNDTAWREKAPVLHQNSEMLGTDFLQTQPELTEFAKELLIPGSTK